MRADRRRFIQAGLVGSLLLAGAAWLARPDATSPALLGGTRFVNAQDAPMLAALAVPMLGLELTAGQREAVVRGVDAAVAGMPLAIQAEVRQLFDLIGSDWGRRYLALVKPAWGEASAAEVAAFLERWRTAPIALLRAGYQALHALINAAWYGQAASHAAIGYARPEFARRLFE
ncbi:hypothetical protein [Crenobacter caeni]|uniref:Gluconate 2-dehydrogenase subunit 3 family protein n=1 Tax=Crenobacter caeni TaxID=2705474 RepID=A0A6B2KQR0_9NEIS|nr:hypothetical protein [Crenobacter caeni]NDV12423.1 hypothetical protein [Crenobacter caeni]